MAAQFQPSAPPSVADNPAEFSCPVIEYEILVQDADTSNTIADLTGINKIRWPGDPALSPQQNLDLFNIISVNVARAYAGLSVEG